MGLLQSYSLIVLKYPERILAAGIASVMLLLAICLATRPLPSFEDPLVGFEVKNTLISNRLNSWKALLDETSPTIASSNSMSTHLSKDHFTNELDATVTTGKNRSTFDADNPSEPPVIENSIQHVGTNFSKDNFEDSKSEYDEIVNYTHESRPDLMHYSLDSDRAFCGKLYEGYTQVVISSSIRYSSSGLLNLNSIRSICELDRRLRLEHSTIDSHIYQRHCERFSIDEQNQTGPSTCCNSWSVPNYIACLSNKTNCMDIDSQDLRNFENLVQSCAPYYHRAPHEECFINANQDKSASHPMTMHLNILAPSGHVLDHLPELNCGTIPERCLACNGWTYTVMNFLVNQNFAQQRTSPNESPSQFSQTIRQMYPKRNSKPVHQIPDPNKLLYTNIFLPVAKSGTLLDYYHALSKDNLKTPYAQVKAMDLGLKNSLFEHLISYDSKLFVIALISIMFVISVYTWSMTLSFVILLIMCLSLGLSYAIYELVFNIPVFPFMNLLAIVISFGICSDNAMLFCKHWTFGPSQIRIASNHTTVQQNGAPLNETSTKESQTNLDRMLKRATISTFMATLSTACSFIISAISKVIAVRCFCIFATLSVITNYLLIVMLLPPALVLDSKFSRSLSNYLIHDQQNSSSIVRFAMKGRQGLTTFADLYYKAISESICKYKFYLVITFMTILTCSSILVFYTPTLQPSNNDDIQLLSSKHAFEQYDKNLKRQFAFERSKMGDAALTNTPNSVFETMPVRIVFGIKDFNNGYSLDPGDRGKIVFDPKFDIADSNAQIWLLEFCRKLGQQRFIHPLSGQDLTNCFMSTFKSWMETRSCRDPIRNDIDRSPCCQAYEFPFSRSTFNTCVGEAIDIIQKTPQANPDINSGVRFFRGSKQIAALVIEYQSNRLFTESYAKMDKFFNDVNDWVTWQINNTAPPSLKSGWFISSNLELLALQAELEQSTSTSILLEVTFSSLALMLATRDLVLTLAGTVAIGTIIITTVAILILLGWTLGVAESILVSLTIGLSIDFALHYSVAYRDCHGPGSNKLTVYRILAEVGSPIALATITTSLAGFVIVWSDILAYQELGVFLMLIAGISWLASTLFLIPILATVDTLNMFSDATLGSSLVQPITCEQPD